MRYRLWSAVAWATVRRTACARLMLGHVWWAAAFGGEEEFFTAAGDTSADVTPSFAAVNSHVYVIDTRIQDSVQDALGLPWF